MGINPIKSLFLLTALYTTVTIAQKATITEENLSLETYGFGDPNPVPILKNNPKIYPYFKFESYSHQAKKKDWKVVTLENEYIKVFVLPEIGGKVWGAIEKSTGNEFLYKNEVIKFRNIAMRGPWTSGGIEFNFGIIGHHPSTATSVDYMLRENTDGSVSCIVGNLDLPSRTVWRVEIRLGNDKAFFETNASWYNPTPVNQSYYNWMTAAAIATDDLEFFIPGNEFLEHNGDPHPWPVDAKNRNLAFYKNNNFGPSKSYHIVGDYKDFFGGYYHNSDFGFGHWSPYEEMPGQKLWLWALSRSGGIWEDLLTDTDGQYIEFQAGRLFNQYSPGAVNPISQANFEPYVMDRWREIWFPFREIGGMEAATEYVVMNMEWKKEGFYLGINALQKINDELKIKVNGRLASSDLLVLDPMEVFSRTIGIRERDTLEIMLGDRKLYYTNVDEKTRLKRPFHPDEALEVSHSRQLFMDGWEAMKFRVFDTALHNFQELVKLDPSYQQAWTKLAELEYRRTNYKKALEHANTVLRMDTYNPEANYLAGIAYRATGDYVNALESLGWAARDMKYRSVGYAQMAEVYLILNNYARAREYAQKALAFNSYNINALQALLLVSRSKTEEKEFEINSGRLREIDPLNHFVMAENYLAGTKGNGLVENIQNEFRSEIILELALYYFNLNRINDALKILDLAAEDTKVKMWRIFLMEKSDKITDDRLLNEAMSASAHFVHPFRRESVQMLEWVQTQSTDWKPKYYLAQNYLAVGLKEKGLALLKALGNQPESDVFYRFRANMVDDLSYEDKFKDYEKALEVNEKDWKVWEEFIQFSLNNENYKAAYELSTKAYKRFGKNYNIGLGHARAALQVDRYAETIKVLKNINILPFEHASESKNIYDDAHIFLASQKLGKNKYREAIVLLEESKKWPENLGVGKPYNVDSRLQDYLLAISYEKIGEADKTKELLMQAADFSMSHWETPSINHLFGFLALEKMGNENELQKVLSSIQNSNIKNDPRINLVMAFFENDIQKLSRLKNGAPVSEELWKIMVTVQKYR